MNINKNNFETQNNSNKINILKFTFNNITLSIYLQYKK